MIIPARRCRSNDEIAREHGPQGHGHTLLSLLRDHCKTEVTYLAHLGSVSGRSVFVLYRNSILLCLPYPWRAGAGGGRGR